MNAALFPNFQKVNALKCARAVCDILNGLGIGVFVDKAYTKEFEDKTFVKYGEFNDFAANADVIIAIGGDGTILKSAKHIIDCGCDAEILGINTGRLGFMAALESEQLELLGNLKTGSYNVVERMMLEAEIKDGEESRVFTALNDVTLSGMYARICDFEIHSDECRIGEYRADGVVFSTPTGSTAYSLSAGGPVIDPEMECMEMTLICPHSLFTRPMIFAPNKTIKFRQLKGKNPDMYFSVDGSQAIKLDINSEVTIRKSEHKVKLIDMTGNLFYTALNRKLMCSIK